MKRLFHIQSNRGAFTIWLLWCISIGVTGYDRVEGNYLLINIILWKLELSIEIGVRK